MIFLELIILGIIFFLMGRYTKAIWQRIIFSVAGYLFLGFFLMGIVYLRVGSFNLNEYIISVLLWPSALGILFTGSS